MRSMKSILFATAAAFIAVTAAAGHYSDLYVIPAVGHTPGVNGTMWRSDVAIYNFQSTPLTIQLIVIESGEGNEDNINPLPSGAAVTVPAMGSVLLADVLDGYRGRASTTGALLIGADRPFAVTSRSYSTTPDGDTVGMTVPASAQFLNVTENPTDLSTAVAYVPGLIENAGFRTNLGLVAANATGLNGPLTIVITLRNASGTAVGTRTVVVQPGATTHVQFSARSVTTQTFGIGSADFRITGGSGSVVPYATVIDNRSADAVFIAGRFPEVNALEDLGAFFPSEFEVMFDRELLTR